MGVRFLLPNEFENTEVKALAGSKFLYSRASQNYECVIVPYEYYMKESYYMKDSNFPHFHVATAHTLKKKKTLYLL